MALSSVCLFSGSPPCQRKPSSEVPGGVAWDLQFGVGLHRTPAGPREGEETGLQAGWWRGWVHVREGPGWTRRRSRVMAKGRSGGVLCRRAAVGDVWLRVAARA